MPQDNTQQLADELINGEADTEVQDFNESILEQLNQVKEETLLQLEEDKNETQEDIDGIKADIFLPKWSISPKVILASGATIIPDSTIMNVQATVGGGAVTLDTTLSIQAGINGQVLIVRGSSATDTIQINDGTGTLMSANIILGLDDIIVFYFDGIVNNKWIEVSRNLNTVQTYTPTNVTTDRAYDADATTVAELADVLGTLIVDLRTWGIIK